MAGHTGPQREAVGLVKRQREQGRNATKAFIGVFVGRNGQGRGRRQTGLGEARVSIFKGPWSVEMVSNWYLALGQ